MLLFEPPPSQGPVKSTVPSGRCGIGPAASASEILGVPPTEIWPTPPLPPLRVQVREKCQCQPCHGDRDE